MAICCGKAMNIYMYEGPSGHIMHVLAARDFKDLKDLQE